jgi:hypothetical protein
MVVYYALYGGKNAFQLALSYSRDLCGSEQPMGVHQFSKMNNLPPASKFPLTSPNICSSIRQGISQTTICYSIRGKNQST